MKKLYFPLGLFLMFLSTGTFAQITLYPNDLQQIGDVFINAIDTTHVNSTLSVPVGANLSWDFSWINNDSLDTISYVDPASTPYGSNFPNATLAQPMQQGFGQQSQSGFIYFLKDQDHLEANGIQMDTISLPFKDPLTYFVFPSTYNTNFTDNGLIDVTIPYDTSAMGVDIDSVRIKRTMLLTDSVLGWGNITTPAFNYDSVLQIKSYEIDTDSIFIHTTGVASQWMAVNQTQTIIDKWEWFAKDKRTALVSMQMSGDTIKALSYFLDLPDSSGNNIETQSIAESPITIFPNPANNFVTIQSKVPVSFIEIFDMAGNCVQSYNINSKKIKTNKLNSGNYFLKSYDTNKKLIGINKLIITH